MQGFTIDLNAIIAVVAKRQRLSLDQNMTGFHAGVGGERASARAGTRLEDHPVYAVLPPKVQAVPTGTARRLLLRAGEPPPSDALFFVLSGALGFFPSRQRVSAGVISPGSVVG